MIATPTTQHTHIGRQLCGMLVSHPCIKLDKLNLTHNPNRLTDTGCVPTGKLCGCKKRTKSRQTVIHPQSTTLTYSYQGDTNNSGEVIAQ